MAQTTTIRTVPFRTPFFQAPQPGDFSSDGTQRWSLNRTWLLFFEQLAGVFQPRIILPGVRSVANDVLANRYRVKQPNGVVLQGFSITAKVAPASSSYIADILRSADGGTTFQSIFPAGNANKLVLPAKSSVKEFALGPTSLAIPILNLNDLIRVDELQADGTVSGIEIVVEGIPL